MPFNLNHLKANAQSVYSTFGGAQYGHLGLVLNPFHYSLVSATPFQIPGPTAPFVVIAQEEANVAQARLHQHNTNVKLFQEVTGVKKALLQQITRAVDDVYLKTLRHPSTNTLEHNNIYDIITHLYSSYGHVSPQKLKDYEDVVRDMVYDPADPIDTMFTAIDNLANIAI